MPGSRSALPRRNDLQGLRGVAVLLVALSHAGVSFLTGGFVGVDVFFVLSGFFITRLLLQEALPSVQEGRRHVISLTGFYARRIRRILPSACLTLIVTNVVVSLTVSYVTAHSVLLDSASATFFYANFHFASLATNYFAEALGGSSSPVQHYWSLSVEEQFYLVWPLLLMVVVLFARRTSRQRASGTGDGSRDTRAVKIAVGCLIATSLLASLAWSVLATAHDQQTAYFSTFARAWELALGAGLAHIFRERRQLPRAVKAPAGWLGVGMIAAAAVSFSSRTAFPGYAALLPTVGAALLIAAGAGEVTAGIRALLSNRYIGYVGDRSYTFYLWHFPVLVLAPQIVGHQLTVLANLVLLVGAFGLSVLTYATFEKPLRYATWLKGRRTAIFAPLPLAAAVLSFFIPLTAIAAYAHTARLSGEPLLRPAAGQPSPMNAWQAKPIPAVLTAVGQAQHEHALPTRIVPSPLAATHNTYYVKGGCDPGYEYVVHGNICHLGDTHSSRVIAIVGDSHAEMWIPAVDWAARRLHVQVVPLIHRGCLLNRIVINPSAEFPCRAWYDWALRKLKALRPVATLVTFRWDFYWHDGGVRFVIQTLRGMLSQVPDGILIADPPALKSAPAVCISTGTANMSTCTTHEGPWVIPTLKGLARMARRTGHPLIPTLQWFCADGLCPAVINHTITRVDVTHMTTVFATELGPLFTPELRRALAALHVRS